MRHRSFIALTVALLLVVAACGGDTNQRVTELEEEVAELRTQLESATSTTPTTSAPTTSAPTTSAPTTTAPPSTTSSTTTITTIPPLTADNTFIRQTTILSLYVIVLGSPDTRRVGDIDIGDDGTVEIEVVWRWAGREEQTEPHFVLLRMLSNMMAADSMADTWRDAYGDPPSVSIVSYSIEGEHRVESFTPFDLLRRIREDAVSYEAWRSEALQ